MVSVSDYWLPLCSACCILQPYSFSMQVCHDSSLELVALCSSCWPSCSSASILSKCVCKVSSFSHALQFKIIVGILLLIFGISLFILLFYFNQDLRVCGIFLKHACYVVKSKLVLFTAIPVFIVLMTILLSLFLVQLLAIWSSANMVFEPRDIYIDPQGNHSVLWTVFNFIMLLWGLEFLKHACKNGLT